MAKAVIYSTFVSQNNIDVIPFWFIAEEGFTDSTQISFTIESANAASIDYSVVLGSSTYSTNIEVPENENAKYRHDAFATVDVLVDDDTGVKDLSVRTQSEIYDYETPSNVYVTPKFSWDNTPFGDEESSDSEVDYDISIFVGTNDKKLEVLRYSNGDVANVLSMNTTSETHKILISSRYGEAYLSEYDSLAKLTANKYRNNAYSVYQTAEITNSGMDIMSYSNSSVIVSTEAYSGKVVVRDISDLSETTSYTGFDAPFKVIRSVYHNAYFVAGTNKVWKLTDAGVKKVIYEVKDFKIADIDCSESGQLCLVLSGTSYDLIRVLDNNLYTFIMNQQSNGDKLRYCKYCGKGLFYVLGEIDNVNNYQMVNYLSNVKSKETNSYISDTAISTTTTTTTLPAPTKRFDLFYPDGGEVLQKDITETIVWQSTASISDEVSIELYKGNNLFEVLASNVKNTGTYSWTISNVYPDGADYKIKGTWLSASNTNTLNYDISSNSFSIVTEIVETTTSTTTPIKVIGKAIGIDYSEYNNTIVIVSDNGLVGIFDVEKAESVGVFDSEIQNILSMAIQDSKPRRTNVNAKARIFVGSAAYLNDKWDSGVVDTGLNYMYYGGGNNLTPGATYFMNLQTFTEKYGWSEVQTKEFIMPL